VPSSRGRRGAVSAFLAPKRKTRLALLLGAPMLWLVVAYLGSIGVLCQLGATAPYRSLAEQWQPGFAKPAA